MTTPGIKAVSAYVPNKSISGAEVAKKFDMDESFVENKTGMLKLRRKDIGDSCLTMAVKACSKLFEEVPVIRERIGLLILVTQTPDNRGIPHVSALLHAELGLDEKCIVFDLGLGCSGYVQSLQIAKSIMIENGILEGLIVTSDQYSDRLNPKDKNTSLLFGDAATATLLGSNGDRMVPCNFDTGINSSLAPGLNHSGSYLSMNGRSVYEFALRDVPPSIQRVLKSSSLQIESIDCFIVHQGSLFIVKQLEERLGLKGSDKIPFFASDVGNAISSSIPLGINALDISSMETVILSGFGVGLSWSTCLLKKWTD